MVLRETIASFQTIRMNLFVAVEALYPFEVGVESVAAVCLAVGFGELQPITSVNNRVAKGVR